MRQDGFYLVASPFRTRDNWFARHVHIYAATILNEDGEEICGICKVIRPQPNKK